MKKINNRNALLLVLLTLLVAWVAVNQSKPVVYLIGDSTVKNGSGRGDGGLWGWGNFLPDHFDTTKVSFQNAALGGRSSRTFITEGHWQKVLDKLKPGDYVLMQFGHNDASPLDDTARARGTIRGISDESKEIFNPKTSRQETVYSYGWYLRKFVRESKSKGATPIICSLIPRNNWKEGKVSRSTNDYGKWAAEIASQEKVEFIDLNTMISDQYEKDGESKVASSYFGTTDHTHTVKAGAELNASIVARGISMLKADLKNFLKKN